MKKEKKIEENSTKKTHKSCLFSIKRHPNLQRTKEIDVSYDPGVYSRSPQNVNQNLKPLKSEDKTTNSAGAVRSDSAEDYRGVTGIDAEDFLFKVAGM